MARRFTVNRRSWLVLTVVAFVVGSAAGVAQVWTNLRSIEYGYKISSATQRRAKLLQARSRLQVEVAALKSPARIAALAARTGMRPPEPEQVRRLGNSTRAGDPSPGSRPAEEVPRAISAVSLAPANVSTGAPRAAAGGRAHATR